MLLIITPVLNHTVLYNTRNSKDSKNVVTNLRSCISLVALGPLQLLNWAMLVVLACHSASGTAGLGTGPLTAKIRSIGTMTTWTFCV